MASPGAGSSSSAAKGRRPQPVPKLGHISFPCSDCSLTFASHQALGGHRKFHTKLLDPTLRKLLRRTRKKAPFVPENASPPAHPLVINQKQLSDGEGWRAVDIKVSDHGVAGGSKVPPKLINFMEIKSAAPKPVEPPATGVIIDDVAQLELDLTLHL